MPSKRSHMRKLQISLSLSVIKIVKYCGVWGGGGGGIGEHQNPTKIMAPPSPLSVIKVVKYIVASGEGGGALGCGLQNPTKDNGAFSLCH